MKKNGFTLTELIGVIIILAALSLIAIPVITKNIKEGKEQAYNDQIDNIKLALEIWMTDNSKPAIGETITITLSQLKYSGLVDLNIYNPKTEELFPNDMELSIINNNGIIEYSFNEYGTNKEEYINIPSIKINGNILEYVEVGSEYIDMGATAKTKEGANIEVTSTTTPTLNTLVKGVYLLKYKAIDDNYSNTSYRTIVVRDTIGPVISYTEKNLKVSLSELDSYDFLKDVQSSDNSGGLVNIIVEKSFKGIAGTYSIKYIASDPSGNQTTIYRKVIVE